MRLKEMRTEWGLTQTDVAKAIGTSQRNIGRWESGLNEPTSSSLVKLADFLGCPWITCSGGRTTSAISKLKVRRRKFRRRSWG